MPSSVPIFLSLLAGYAFVHLFYFTRFRAQRLDGYRLLIESGIVGIVLYAAARILEPYTPGMTTWLSGFFPKNSELADTMYVVSLGLLAPVTLNLVIAVAMRGETALADDADTPSIGRAWSNVMEPARRAALNWAIRKLGNDLLLLLHDAATRPRERQMTLHVTTDTGKVFIGWVTRSPNLKLEDEYLSMLPLASGYRKKDTMEMELNVFYPIEQYSDRGGALDPREFAFVIPYASIKKANFFDVGVYVNHFLRPETASPAEPKT